MATSQTTIRPAQRFELPAVAAAVIEQPLFERYELTSARLTALLEAAIGRDEPVIVAEVAGVLAGFAWFQRTGALGTGGYLRLIALAPERAGQGIGTALLDEVERQVAEQSRHMFLLVSDWNGGARRFYAERGYREVGRLPGFVRPDIDEVLCWKRV